MGEIDLDLLTAGIAGLAFAEAMGEQGERVRSAWYGSIERGGDGCGVSWGEWGRQVDDVRREIHRWVQGDPRDGAIHEIGDVEADPVGVGWLGGDAGDAEVFDLDALALAQCERGPEKDPRRQELAARVVD
jgi:hypothetical protein